MLATFDALTVNVAPVPAAVESLSLYHLRVPIADIWSDDNSEPPLYTCAVSVVLPVEFLKIVPLLDVMLIAIASAP